MKKQLLLTRMLLLVALLVGSTSVWGADTLVETIDFTSSNSSRPSISSYGNSSTWGNWTIVGAANNSNGWEYLRIGGGKKNSSPSTITRTTSGISQAIDYIEINHEGRSGSSFSITSITAEASNSTDFTDPTATKTVSSPSITSAGTIKIEFDSRVAANSYYKITINWSNSGSSNAGLNTDNVKFYQKAPSYSITAESNNTDYGTVSLSGSVITGSPNSGYRYASPAYTVSPENSATVSQDGNAFTVTPSANTTVTINFEAIPTHTLNTAVAPVSSGTITLGGTTVAEGSTTIATAAAEAGYKFTGWSITGTGASLSSTSTNPTTVTMGTTDATITANFEAVTTYAITWNVNGVNVRTDNVEEDADIDFPTSISGVPTGYALKGWSATEILTPQSSAPSYVTSATSTVDKTYYAVIAKENFTPIVFSEYEKVTSAPTDWSGTYILGATYNGGTDEDKKGTFVFSGFGATTGNREKVTPGTTELSEYEIIIAKSGEHYTIYHTNSSKYFALTSNENQLHNSASVEGNPQLWDIDDDGIITSVNYSTRSLQYNGSSPRFACYTSNQVATDLYKRITTGGTSYSGYCTTAPVPVEVSALGYATFASDKALDFTDKSIKAYKATVTGTTVNFTQVNVVPANTGVLLYAASGASIDVPVATAAADDFTGNKLVRGTGAALTYAAGTAEYYILANETAGIGFYKANNNTVATNRAYLDLTGTNAKSFALPGGETDGIKSVQGSRFTVNGEAYNLAGQRVGKDYKGIVIVNGKKMLNK